MIVTCPNCRARYAVDPLKIGPSGRIVQCARCTHRWFETVESGSPAPELVIRPTTVGASLPAVIPPKPAFPWARVALVVLVIALIGAALFAFRHEISGMIASAVSASAPATVAAAPSQARPAAVPLRPHIEIDLEASKIDVVDGRYVVRGEVVNNGTAAGSTSLLHVIFKRNDDVLGQRSFPMVEGPLPPGGRASFSQALDEPPAGTNEIVPVVE